MPSSPGPNDYKRTLQRFFYRGLSLVPQDALPEGKSSWALNIRSHEDGTWEPRYGETVVTQTPLPAAIHSLFRLNDPTPYSAVGARRILGSGTSLYGGTPGVDTYAAIDTGYSGLPLTSVAATPITSPRPYLYVADAQRMRKVNADLTVYEIGLRQPADPPSAVLAAPQVTYMNSVGVAPWTTYGGRMVPLAPAPAPVGTRINTTVTGLLWDTGIDGWAAVQLADMSDVTVGVSIDIGAAPQSVLVHSVHPPVAPTIIGSILYDSGNTGLCTIQPDGGFNVGQIELARPQDIERRYRELGQSTPPRLTVSRTVDFPVDSLVVLNSVETVRILSVALGQDGVMSFRCFTTGTYAAGTTIAGVAAFRAYFNLPAAVGDPAVANELVATFTAAADDSPEVGGFQGPMLGSTRNWASVGNRAMQPNDIIRFGLRIDKLAFITSVRLMLDVSPIGPAFQRDFFQYEWRASDLVEAIQRTAEDATGLVSDAQAKAVQRGEIARRYPQNYGHPIESSGTVVPYPDDPTQVDKAPTTPNVLSPAPEGSAAAQRQAIQDGVVSTGSSLSRQLALGNDGWFTLECRVGDLTRVGSDTTLTLAQLLSAAIYATSLGTTDPIEIHMSDPYLVGGYGPDIGTILPPYVYRYSYRSTLTGEKSNLSPSMRAGVRPRRGRVSVTTNTTQEAQCDLIDVWKFGGALARWVYVGSAKNNVNVATVDFDDDLADEQVDGGQPPWVDRYQPWPTQDLPRAGTCNVAGTAVEWVDGDQFNVDWAADSLIIINGRATQIYRSPESATRLEIVDNVGTGTGVAFSLPDPTILSSALPVLFGGPISGAWFHFGLGDPSNPGLVYWTHGNDPDAASDANWVAVTSGSDRLMNGFVENGIPYVWSTEQLYVLQPQLGGLNVFIPSETGCKRGLWSRWFWCHHPDGGVFFGAKDGIYFTVGGGPAKNITAKDLQPLFPQDGTDALPIRNLNPIDWTQHTRLRLAFVDALLYFDYIDVTGQDCTLVYDPRLDSWIPDLYAVGIQTRLSEPGDGIHDQILARADGRLTRMDVNSLVDLGEDGLHTALPWALWTPWAHGEDPRAFKQWGDAILDFNPGGSLDGVTVTPVLDNGNLSMTPRVVGAGDGLRATYLIEVGQGTGLGYGELSRNFGMWIEGVCAVCDTNRPLFFLWEPAYIWKGTSVARRATDWEDLGYKGAKFVQGVVLRANTFGVAKILQVQFDGVNANPQVGLTFAATHDGEQSIAYPQSGVGWPPFVAELVRLQGADDLEWILHDWRFVWEPAPEAATQWETQYTTFDLPGFLAIYDGVIAYQSLDTVQWAVEYQDGASALYSLPSTGGLYRRSRVILQAQKGKAVRFRWTSSQPFRLFKRDISVRVQGWGMPNGYMVASPFGGPHRVDGAGI